MDSTLSSSTGILERVLVIKMSSIGDIVHTFPALSDAKRVYPDIVFDWVVEAPFSELPSLHYAVENVFSNHRRDWQKRRFSLQTWKEQKAFKALVRQNTYQCIIENQYTRKGGKVARIALGETCGLNKDCAHDPDISRHFDRSFYVSRSLHAIERTRKLFALSLGYEYEPELLDYGIDKSRLIKFNPKQLAFDFTQPYYVFCQGTTWESKHLPIQKWIELLQHAKRENIEVILPWAGKYEKQQVEQMILNAGHGVALPELALSEWSYVLNLSLGIIGVDTGLTHLATGLDKPTLALFGPTNPLLTGVKGKHARSLTLSKKCSPCMSETCEIGLVCFQDFSSQEVWQSFMELTVS